MATLPLKIVIVSNTVSQDGNITFRIDDAQDANVLPVNTQTFPTKTTDAQLYEILSDILSQFTSQNTKLSAGSLIE